MPETNPSEKLRDTKKSLIRSAWLGRIANLPLVAWGLRIIGRVTGHILTERRVSVRPRVGILVEEVGKVGLEATLQQIVYDVVESLGYASAMVATLEQGDTLPVRAFYIHPSVATMEQVQQWEEEASRRFERPLSITNGDIAVAYVHQPEYKDNLSVRSFETGGPIITNEVADLCIPIAPPAARPFLQGIQEALGIEQVIAVPFFLETLIDGLPQKEIVGNLFAAKHGAKISAQDERIIAAFGRQAATAIESERRRLQIEVAQDIVYAMQSSLQDEERILQRIVKGVVSDLGYVAAMVATYESDGSLPVRAFYIHPGVATMEQVHQWEEEASLRFERSLSITNGDIAVAYVHQPEYKDNLSVRSFETGGPVTTNEVADLCIPIAPSAVKPFLQGIQETLGIEQVIAVPFFLETLIDDQPQREIVGNLFAATRSKRFRAGEIDLLRAFGLQAAVGIRNARLYSKSEERRKAAQIFGKMAFSAAAYVHDLRNYISAVRLQLQLWQRLKQLPEKRKKQLDSTTQMLTYLDKAANILDTLHEPWRQVPDVATDVNRCLIRAINKSIPDPDIIRETERIEVKSRLAEDLPPIKTSPDILSEAFRVLVKNALEALREKRLGGELRIESRLSKNDDSVVEVLISDTGTGIRPENLSKVFEIKWSTKRGAGMGFGLFWTKDYINGLEGRIEVESVWQEGTTFCVSLPAFIEHVISE